MKQEKSRQNDSDNRIKQAYEWQLRIHTTLGTILKEPIESMIRFFVYLSYEPD